MLAPGKASGESGDSDFATTKRPVRQSAKAVSALLKEIRIDQEDSDRDQSTAVEESQAKLNDNNDEYEEAEEEEEEEEEEEAEIVSVAVTNTAVKKGRKVVKVEAPASEESSDDDGRLYFSQYLYYLTFFAADFMFTMEVLSASKQSRTIDVVSSSISLYSLQQKIASALNIYPETLQVQYRFSTDPKDSLCCDLITHGHFNLLLRLLRERTVPAKLANGRRSTRKMKAFTLQVFNKGDSPYSADVKVRRPFFVCILTM